MEDKKTQLLQALINSKSIISIACIACNLSRQTYYRWCDTDPEFKAKADEIMEMQGDLVESKLLGQIEAGDTQAIIFYCKTKLKHRGYTDKVAQPQQPLPMPETPQLTSAEKSGISITKKIENKKRYIIKVLKEQGKYTAELSMQVKIVAQLLVKTETLAAEVFDDDHKAVNIQISREGNERETISAKEKLYLDYLQQSQRALRALGMNTDAKERKNDSDGFNDFMNSFKEDGEE